MRLITYDNPGARSYASGCIWKPAVAPGVSAYHPYARAPYVGIGYVGPRFWGYGYRGYYRYGRPGYFYRGAVGFHRR